jgi:hypothetical protein
MIFCAFLDPDSIRKASGLGEVGMDQLLGVLRDLLENCLLAETTDWQVGSELKEAIKAIPDTDLRKKAASILETFANRNRFASFLDPNGTSMNMSVAAVALANRDHAALDVIVTEVPPPYPEGRAEITSVTRFNSSQFASNRSRSARGITLHGGEFLAGQFFQEHFSRLLLVVEKFEIWDYAIGKYGFGGDYYPNLKWWIGFLSQADSDVELTIHTVGNQQSAIQRCLDLLCQDTCVRPMAEIHDKLPHERYLVTNAFTFDIGRGIDLIDPNTGMNRDIRIALSPPWRKR